MTTTIKVRFKGKHKIQFFMWFYNLKYKNEIFCIQMIYSRNKPWVFNEWIYNVNINLFNESGDNIIR